MAELTSEENLLEFTGIACDSREVKPGYAFVAIKGFKTDGNKFIDEAIRNGARLSLQKKQLPEREIWC